MAAPIRTDVDAFLFEAPTQDEIFEEIANLARISRDILADEYERLGRYLDATAKLGSLIDVNA